MTIIWAVGFATIILILAIRLWRYHQQINYLLQQMKLLEQEDTNYCLSSYCRIGKTEELIGELNRIWQLKRAQMSMLKRGNQSYRTSIIGISHDIRTPLTSAKGYTQMLLGGMVTDEEKKRLYISKIEKRMDDVVDLLELLFEYARLEAGEIVLETERLNLCNIFSDTLSLFYDDFIRLGYEPTVIMSESPCFIRADAHAAKRIIENLIKNALVHGTGDFRFCLQHQGKFVKLSAENLTQSIESSDIEHIFDRFYTTEQSKTRKVTGLGLTIVKYFTEEMGGTVSAALCDHTFTITILFPMYSSSEVSSNV